jgi:UDP-N-acetylmuramoyl-tripeptide--D-alanyl-D-alanine ligase
VFNLQEIAQVCGGTLIRGGQTLRVSGVSIDSRTLQAGEIFAALRGGRFDGHDFLGEAFRKGAVCALVERDANAKNPAILVEDTLKALQTLARFHRSRFSIPAVAVTGSVGKTTTKECIGVLLSDVFRVRFGFGNFNNHIGVPLNLLSLSPGDQCLVLELGANHPGEISFLSRLAQPTVGVITGVAPAHLEGFGSRDRIYEAKLELADYLSEKNGTVIANGDDPELLRRLKEKDVRVITFGARRNLDFYLSRLIARDGMIYFQVNDSLDFRLRGSGGFNAFNALAAVAAASYFRLDLPSLAESWRMLPALEGRFEVIRWPDPDVLLVNDAYNASPYAFERAVESFQELAGERRKIMVVGDMLELGSEAERFHEDLGQALAQANAHWVIGIGSLSRFTLSAFHRWASAGNTIHFESSVEAGKFLFSIVQDGDAILLKGSHAMKLGEIKQALEKRFEMTAAAGAK